MQVPCHACLSAQSIFATPWTVAHKTPLSMGFSRQEYWSGLPFPSPGDLPHPGTEPAFPALAYRFFTTASPGNCKCHKDRIFFFLMASAIKTRLFSPCLFTIVFTASCFGSGTQHGLHTLAAWKKRIALRQSNPGLMLFILKLGGGVTSSKGVYVAYGR